MKPRRFPLDRQFGRTSVNSAPATRASLLLRLRDGDDQQAWIEFTSLYEPVIYAMTRRRGLQDADAREIVQEVLWSVARRIEKFDVQQGGSFRGWLSTITRNATIDRMRELSSRRETNSASGQGIAIHELVAAEPIEDEFETEHRQQLFRLAASEIRGRIDETNWTAFWRSMIEGDPIDQVAQDLNITRGAVYVARCRVIKRIRRWIEERTEA